jgi:hypothetical protein
MINPGRAKLPAKLQLALAGAGNSETAPDGHPKSSMPILPETICKTSAASWLMAQAGLHRMRRVSGRDASLNFDGPAASFEP